MKNLEDNDIHIDNITVDNIILESIDNVLLSVLGKKSYKEINKSIKNYSIKWDEVPHNAKIFSILLMEILGRAHIIIEDLIVENIYEKLEVKFTVKKDYKFHNYISELIKQHEE